MAGGKTSKLKKILDELQENLERYNKQPTPDPSSDGPQAYSTDGPYINEMLQRAAKGKGYRGVDKDTQVWYREIVEDLDSLIDRYRLTDPLQLFRGDTRSVRSQLASDPGYRSFSADPAVAQRYTQGSKKPTLLWMEASPGERMMALKGGANDFEREVLLPRNTSLEQWDDVVELDLLRYVPVRVKKAKGGKTKKKRTVPGTLSKLARAASRREVDKDTNQRLLMGLLSQLYGLNEEGEPRFLGGLGRGYGDRPAVPGIVDEVLALPAVVEELGGSAPQFAKDAEARIQLLRDRLSAEMELAPPKGLRQHMATAGGEMLGQLPMAGRSLVAKAPGWAKKLSAVPRAVVEYMSPVIRPSLSNYLSGTVAGGALGALGDEEEDMDDLSALQHKYAEGGQVKRTARAVKAIRSAINQLEAGDQSAAAKTLRASADAMADRGVASIVRAMSAPRKKETAAPKDETPAADEEDSLDAAIAKLPMSIGGSVSGLLKEVLAKIQAQTGMANPKGPQLQLAADPVRMMNHPNPPQTHSPGVAPYQAVNQMATHGRQGGPGDASFYYSYGAGPEQKFFTDARYVTPPGGPTNQPGGPGNPGSAPQGPGRSENQPMAMDLNNARLIGRGRAGLWVRLPDGTMMTTKDFQQQYGWLPTEHYAD